MHGPTCIVWANLTPFSLGSAGCCSKRLHQLSSAPHLWQDALRRLPSGDALQRRAESLDAAGLDEGLLSLSLSNLLYMENPHSHKKCQ